MTSVLRVKDRVAAVTSVALYVAVGILYLGSGLVVPEAVAYGLWGVWLVGLVVTLRVSVRQPLWSLVVAPGALVFWVGFVQTGSWLFGWTA